MSQMIPDPVEARATLRNRAETVLHHLRTGTAITQVETERLDLKEEAGRRDRTGALLPPAPTNTAAADALAEPNASTALSNLAAAHDVVRRGPGKGRAAHFVRAGT